MARRDEQRDGVISLHGMCFTAIHGVYDSEKVTPQRFVVDVDLVSSFPNDDDLTGTVDYSVLVERIAEVVLGEPVNLIETLASKIAALCLQNELVSEVTVRVNKPDATLRITADVSVLIRRTK